MATADAPLFKDVTSFFVVEFYQNIYNSARNSARNSKDASITKAYIDRVRMYIVKVKNDKRSYSRLIKDLHEYCDKNRNLTFTDFLQRFITSFIPGEYEDQFTTRNYDELLCKIITDFLGMFAKCITKPDTLKKVIDNHKDKQNVLLLQLEAMNILKHIQRKISYEFTCAFSDAKETVNIEIVNKLKDENENLANELNKIAKENENLIKQLNELNDLYTKDMAIYRDKIEDLNKAIEKYKRLSQLLARQRITIAKPEPEPIPIAVPIPSPVREPEPEPVTIADMFSTPAPEPLTEDNLRKHNSEHEEGEDELDVLNLANDLIQFD